VATTKQPLPPRSQWIAAQPLAHILTSKLGKVLLMKRMGILPPPTPVLSASKQTYDALFIGNLTPSHVVALDELFPATNSRAGRRALFLDAKGGSRAQLATETPNLVGGSAALSLVVNHLCTPSVHKRMQFLFFEK
jgi:hypothetical protein